VGQHLRHAYGHDKKLVVVNKGPQEAGFRVCERCGAAKPSSEDWGIGSHPRPYKVPTWISRKYKIGKNCSGPARSVYLGHSFRTDLMLLRISCGAPIVCGSRDPWTFDCLATLAEGLSMGASRDLDIDPGELSANFRLMPPLSTELSESVMDLYMFDTASGGAGYAAMAGESLSRVLESTLTILERCKKKCERSCTACLRHYGNRYLHPRFDRHLASSLLRYAVNGTIPTAADVDVQVSQLTPLHGYLQLEGWKSQLNQKIDGVSVPLVIRHDREAIVV